MYTRGLLICVLILVLSLAAGPLLGQSSFNSTSYQGTFDLYTTLIPTANLWIGAVGIDPKAPPIPPPGKNLWWYLTGNTGTTPGVNFLGTRDNKALELKVNNTRALRIEPVSSISHGSVNNVIGGYSGNSVVTGVAGAVIGGGGAVDHPNVVGDDYGTVSGGEYNSAGNGSGSAIDAGYATVGGGLSNYAQGYASTVSGGMNNTGSLGYSTVAGGYTNSASGEYSSVGGGIINQAGGYASTVAGGHHNVAPGVSAAIPGGNDNHAAGDYSFAAGHRAKADNKGAFVWADSTDADFSSTADNQFLIRATGGVGIGTNNPQTPLQVYGVIYSSFGGFKFPDGTIQTSAATGGANAWNLTGNAGTNPSTNFIGTTDNQPLEIRQNNKRALRIEYDTSGPLGEGNKIIGGYWGNSIDQGSTGATIAGGGWYYINPDNYQYVSEPNKITGSIANLATIGGGGANEASNFADTISGGQGNKIDGGLSTICGGYKNDVSGWYSTVAGGKFNTAEGDCSTVAGGSHNSAVGVNSLAAGYQTAANNDGCFVWGDKTQKKVYSTAPNQFVVRATGGIWLGTTNDNISVPYITASIPEGVFINTSTGAYLTTGGVWTNNSDKALKENFVSTDARKIAEKVANMPISTWNYRAEGKEVRHIGPTAQDFTSAFNIGTDEKHISTVDADGVALSAIQGLYQMVQEKDAKITELQQQIEELKRVVDTLAKQK